MTFLVLPGILAYSLRAERHSRTKQMLDPTWTLIIGLPIIALLLVMVFRRARAVSIRIREVRAEMARNPQDPYRALAELMAEKPEGRNG